MGIHRSDHTLVTGGTGAVGEATCRRLLAAGHDITFTYRSNAQAADALVTHAQGLGRHAKAISVDLSDAEATAALVATAVAHAPLTSVIHASGPFVPQKYLSSATSEEVARHLHLETGAFFNLLAPLLPHLRESQGNIVAVTTVALRRFPIRDGLSPASKAGIEALVRVVAAEEGKFGVRANCVGPGLLEEGLAADLMETGQFGDEAQEHAKKQVPLRRFGKADEVAAVAVFLASSAASYVSGQFVDVDGGYSL